MSSGTPAPPPAPPAPIDWTGVAVERVDYDAGAEIFTQGDKAESVMYVERGTVRLSVLSHAGKEAVIAVLDDNHFFGEGCLVGQPFRMATASAMAAAAIVVVAVPIRTVCPARQPSPKKSPAESIATMASCPVSDTTASLTPPFWM